MFDVAERLLQLTPDDRVAAFVWRWQMAEASLLGSVHDA